MSVLIKGIEMPKSCSKCDLRVIAIGLDFQCALSGETVDDYYSTRHKKCSLVDIPTPHGRLIDADRLIKIMQDTLGNYPDNDNDGKAVEKLVVETCKQFIDHCPTIIEAEVSE